MKITSNYQLNSINNSQNQKLQKSNPQFRAFFSEAQLKEMTKHKQFGEYINRRDYFPRLFVLLGHLLWIRGGELAKWNVEEGTITIGDDELKPNTAHKKYDAVDEFLKQHPGYEDVFKKEKKDIVSILENILVEQDEPDSYFCGSEPMPIEYMRMPKTEYDHLRYKLMANGADNIIHHFSYEKHVSKS